MTTYPLQRSASAVITNGSASVQLGPQLARERWNVTYTTVTSLGMNISVALSDSTVADSTLNDMRPTVTDDTIFDIPCGKFLRITWQVANSGVANGTSVTATVFGTKGVGSAV